MITGQQIMKARNLLGMSVAQMAQRFDLTISLIRRAEAADGEPAITIAQGGLIQNMFEKRGIVFDADGVDVRRASTSKR